MLSELINWDYVVEYAKYGRESFVEHLLDTYALVASAWDGELVGEDAHLYHNPWGVIVIVWPYDDRSDDDDSPLHDPRSDAYRAELKAIIGRGDFYSSFREAAAEIRELGVAAGAAARLLPDLDRFSTHPPRHDTMLW